MNNTHLKQSASLLNYINTDFQWLCSPDIINIEVSHWKLQLPPHDPPLFIHPFIHCVPVHFASTSFIYGTRTLRFRNFIFLSFVWMEKKYCISAKGGAPIWKVCTEYMLDLCRTEWKIKYRKLNLIRQWNHALRFQCAPVTKQFITHFRLNNNRTVTAVTKATTNEQNGMYIGSQLTHSHRVWQGLPGANWWDKHIRTRLDYICELWRVQHVPSMKYVSKCSKWIYADRVYHILSANQLCARLILQMNFISLHFYQGLDSGNGWK